MAPQLQLAYLWSTVFFLIGFLAAYILPAAMQPLLASLYRDAENSGVLSFLVGAAVFNLSVVILICASRRLGWLDSDTARLLTRAGSVGWVYTPCCAVQPEKPFSSIADAEEAEQRPSQSTVRRAHFTLMRHTLLWGTMSIILLGALGTIVLTPRIAPAAPISANLTVNETMDL